MAGSAIRRREVSPGFWRNEDLRELGTYSRLLFIAMWAQADRDGRLEDRPRRIHYTGNFPDSEVSSADPAIEKMAACGLVLRYEAGGTRYLQILNFTKHQRVHPKESPSEIPPPPQLTEGEPRVNLGQPKVNLGEPRENLGAPEASQGSTKVSSLRPEPSVPSEPSYVEPPVEEARQGLPTEYPLEAGLCSSSAPATQAQADELAALAETTGTDLDEMLQNIGYGSWTKRAASVAIDKYRELRDDQRAERRKARNTPPNTNPTRDAHDVWRETLEKLQADDRGAADAAN